MNGSVFPVILSGGSGSRLWPVSRASYPKQLAALAGDRSLLQQTVLRGRDNALFASPVVVASAEHRFAVAEQLQEIGVDRPAILLEPQPRNTAAAIAAAAHHLVGHSPDALMLVMPADHALEQGPGFVEAVGRGAAAARAGRHVLFGITPSGPATGYGYIRPDPGAGEEPFRVAEFIEKPDHAVAERLVAERCLWNSGIFLFRAAGLLAELERLEPGIVQAASAAVERAVRDLDFIRLDAAAFEASPSESIDYALMEKTPNAVVIPLGLRWTDVGSWSALWELGPRDEHGNLRLGDVFTDAASGSYLRSEGPIIAAVGVQDLIVVATKDAVLVAHKGADQRVRQMVEQLRAAGRESATDTVRVHRPWGWYERLDSGAGFQVKRITVKAGHKLSLQKHAHRAEHWVVVTGAALVTVGDQQQRLAQNESVYIPAGEVHRLENPGEGPLSLVEVQVGGYLGEDDIVRLEDAYSRC